MHAHQSYGSNALRVLRNEHALQPCLCDALEAIADDHLIEVKRVVTRVI